MIYFSSVKSLNNLDSTLPTKDARPAYVLKEFEGLIFVAIPMKSGSKYSLEIKKSPTSQNQHQVDTNLDRNRYLSGVNFITLCSSFEYLNSRTITQLNI